MTTRRPVMRNPLFDTADSSPLDRAAFRQGYDTPITTPPPVGITPAQPPSVSVSNRKPSKYTLLMDQAVAMALAADEVQLQSDLGWRPTRSLIFRELLALLHSDPAVYDLVCRRLAVTTDRRNNGGAP